MGDWIAFWDSEHSIYVNARHRDVHYRTIAQDIRALVPSGAAVLDYGCGDALHADLVAAPARELILCEAAPSVRVRPGGRSASPATATSRCARRKRSRRYPLHRSTWWCCSR